MISDFSFGSFVVSNSPSAPRKVSDSAGLRLELPLWLPGSLLNLSQVEASVEGFVEHFASLHLGWRYRKDSHGGGLCATGLLQADCRTGEIWGLIAMQRSTTGWHRHLAGGPYGECVMTLAGELFDSLDNGVPVRLATGAVMFHAPNTIHEAVAETYWAGIYHQPRGSETVG
jgi:hypothetical protein